MATAAGDSVVRGEAFILEQDSPKSNFGLVKLKGVWDRRDG
ncbi:MAG: hypothetical protein P8Z39_01925 [Gammaproteobacteria bacterium]